MSMRFIVALATLLAAALIPRMADAAVSGVVTGVLGFFQDQGNFCPSTRNCTGAKYPESQFQTVMPVADTKVYVSRSSDNVVIGQGVTGPDGSYAIYYYDPASTNAVVAYVHWRAQHKDDRFSVRSSTGATWVMWTDPQPFFNVATVFGTRVWGTPSAPHDISNVYDGARRTWGDALSQSSRMVSYFTGVQIWMNSTGTCTSSCADGPARRVLLDVDAPYAPQSNVMHEMGHIASYVSNRDQTRRMVNKSVYCYPSTSGSCGWSLDTPEWGSAGFEEALATFYGSVALYDNTAVEPYFCSSVDACYFTLNMETSLGAAACPTDENRKPQNALRFLWDVYDVNVDATDRSWSQFSLINWDTHTRSFYEFFDVVNVISNGTDNLQKDEVWDSTYTALDDYDGRSTVDIKNAWFAGRPILNGILTHNCAAVGD